MEPSDIFDILIRVVASTVRARQKRFNVSDVVHKNDKSRSNPQSYRLFSCLMLFRIGVQCFQNFCVDFSDRIICLCFIQLNIYLEWKISIECRQTGRKGTIREVAMTISIPFYGSMPKVLVQLRWSVELGVKTLFRTGNRVDANNRLLVAKENLILRQFINYWFIYFNFINNLYNAQ